MNVKREKLGMFLFGIFLGVIFILFVIIIVAKLKEHHQDKNLTLYENPGKTITYTSSSGEEKAAESFMVVQCFEKGKAIVVCRDVEDYYLTAFLLDENGEFYYDKQIIRAPKEKVFKEIGEFKYDSGTGPRAIPVIAIKDKTATDYLRDLKRDLKK